MEEQPEVLDISALYAEHGAFVARAIQRLVGPGPDVDDILQETFVVAFRRLDDFEGRSSERTWLYSIAANLCAHHHRSNRRGTRFRARLAQETQSAPRRPDEQLEYSEAVAVVQVVLQQLPFKQREVYTLYELEELEGRDIAALVDIPIGTVWTRLHKARQNFERLMRRRMAKEVVA